MIHSFQTDFNLQIDSGNGSTYLTEAGYYCHRKFDVILPIIDSIRFWIEGISLTIIAIFGLMGNLLTVVVFRNYDRSGSGNGNNHLSSGRSPFNTILTTLVTFDSFFLVFSLFDSGYATLFHLPEPTW